MKLQVSRLDIKKTRTHWPADIPFLPALVYAKQPGVPEDWIVVDQQMRANTEPSFALTTSDQYVRIPLFEYPLSHEADVALASMIQFGFFCSSYIAKPVQSLHIVAGNPVDLLYADGINTPTGLRYWFGLAFSVEK